MRAEPDQFKSLGIGRPVDQYQVGLDVAVAMVNPFTSEGVIAEPFR